MIVFLLDDLKLKQNDPSESCSCCRSIEQTVYLETDSCSDFIQDDFPYVVCNTETGKKVKQSLYRPGVAQRVPGS
jgi:hypothetical protein